MNKQDEKLYTKEELKIYLTIEKDKHEVEYSDLNKRYMSVLDDSMKLFNSLKNANKENELLKFKLESKDRIIDKLKRSDNHG